MRGATLRTDVPFLLLCVLLSLSNISVMSFSHICLGFHLFLFHCVMLFFKPECLVAWPKYFMLLGKFNARLISNTIIFSVPNLLSYSRIFVLNSHSAG